MTRSHNATSRRINTFHSGKEMGLLHVSTTAAASLNHAVSGMTTQVAKVVHSGMQGEAGGFYLEPSTFYRVRVTHVVNETELSRAIQTLSHHQSPGHSFPLLTLSLSLSEKSARKLTCFSWHINTYFVFFFLALLSSLLMAAGCIVHCVVQHAIHGQSVQGNLWTTSIVISQ